MQPRIEQLDQTTMIGVKMTMSFKEDKTRALWQSFMPRLKDIESRTNTDLYSIEVFPSAFSFLQPDFSLPFEKWAGVEVKENIPVPDGLNGLVIPSGEYAVFHYKGKPSEVMETLQYIHGTWFPDSEFKVDDRPHFARMGDKYLGEDPNSEEEFWIPVRSKTTSSN